MKSPIMSGRADTCLELHKLSCTDRGIVDRDNWMHMHAWHSERGPSAPAVSLIDQTSSLSVPFEDAAG